MTADAGVPALPLFFSAAYAAVTPDIWAFYGVTLFSAAYAAVTDSHPRLLSLHAFLSGLCGRDAFIMSMRYTIIFSQRPMRP